MQERNKPTPEGRKIGAQLARLTERALVQFKDADPPFQQPCTTCAFRGGSFPNGCTETVLDAIKCVMEGVPFYCHETKDCKSLCKGWYLAQASLLHKPKMKCPWKFSHECDIDETCSQAESEVKRD